MAVRSHLVRMSVEQTGGERTAIERMARWAAGLRLSDVPARVVEKVRLQIATSISSAALSPWHEMAERVRRTRRSRGSALVWATGERMAPLDAAYVNSAFSMSLDYDDYLLSAHPSHSAVLVPLAFAERIEDVVVAAVAANEVIGRMSTACLMGPLNGQTTSYIHDAGAAVALGKVLGLDAGGLASAMGIALYQPHFCLVPGFWDEGSKTVTASMALEQGVRAAQLAAAGVTGARDVIEHPMGLSTYFSFARFPGLYEALGDVWFSDTLSFKRYPGTSYVSAAVEGALELSGGERLGPGDVDQVRVETTILSSVIDGLGARALEREPLDANAVNFSVRGSVAAALLFGDLTVEHMRPELLAAHGDEIRALAAKVRVEHDAAQSVRLFTGSPLGASMLAHLGPLELGRLAAHGHRTRRASERRSATVRNVRKAVGELLRRVVAARGKRVSARDLDAARFRMYQSARTHLSRAGRVTTAMVDIPLGACGRDAHEARDLVRWRLRAAFGEKARALWERLFDPEATVAQLEQAARGPRQRTFQTLQAP